MLCKSFIEPTADVLVDDADEVDPAFDDAEDIAEVEPRPPPEPDLPLAPVTEAAEALVDPLGDEPLETKEERSAAADPPAGNIDSNSLIKGNDFIRFLELTAPEPGLDTEVVAEMVLMGDIVCTFSGEALEMNWLNPDKSKECVL